MGDLKEIVRRKLFGGKIKLRSDERKTEVAAPVVATAGEDSTPPEVSSET